MKPKSKKLNLNRETLHRMTLKQVAAGAVTNNLICSNAKVCTEDCTVTCGTGNP
jgi:hypothetical protein